MLRHAEKTVGVDELAKYRTLVNAIWECLAGNEAGIGAVRDEVSRIESLLADPYSSESPELEEADNDHAAAAFYAAAALTTKSAEPAANAANRAIEACSCTLIKHGACCGY